MIHMDSIRVYFYTMGLSQKDNELSLRKWRNKQKVCSGMYLLFRPPSAYRTVFTAPGMLVCGRNIC